ncbi:unnamed protein product [Toxocara canis]|uniref:Apple domain-containing protein n=1 Tax=Toxocara canis TaxID=6265 RepID=A0A183UZF3_TOXCA|nr:unnamed protein product [Toxocara canis]
MFSSSACSAGKTVNRNWRQDEIVKQERIATERERGGIAIVAAHQLSRTVSFMRCPESLKRATFCTLNRRFLTANFTNIYSVITLATLLTTAQAAGRCFVNGPGTSIGGADYRRDYDITLKDCAITCREDQCCMAFEWLVDGTCTLKSRSLNGTVANVEGVHFGLCLDTDDADRNRFWDHEVFGPKTGAVKAIDREECADFCSTLPDTQMYSWKSSNPRNMDELLGDCTCIKELNRIELVFGSFSGVLI